MQKVQGRVAASIRLLQESLFFRLIEATPPANTALQRFPRNLPSTGESAASAYSAATITHQTA
jgi:hypothetical protein